MNIKNTLLRILVGAFLLFGGTPVVAEWKSFVTPRTLAELSQQAQVVIIDARSEEQYHTGHIPGAVSIPGKLWRTPKAKPGAGNSQYIFRTASGTPDVTRYEKFLGQYGLKASDHVVVYGNHAGKTDGSIPALILHWLGHQRVAFLDGVGVEEWKKAGYQLTSSAHSLPATTYKASPRQNYIWQLDEVLNGLNNPGVIFYDTRSIDEYAGVALRDNQFGGRIPGAIVIDYSDLLEKETHRVKSSSEIQKILRHRGITPDKQIVLYCQTATRVSLPALALHDLGYENVAIYDASWHEYGNLNSTPIEGKVTRSRA